MTEPIVITGVSGFVGRTIAKDLLSKGLPVVGMSRTNPEIPGLNFIRTDLSSVATLPTDFTRSTVVHCAALTEDGKGPAFKSVNFEGTKRALQLNPEGKFIHLSSSSIYRLDRPSYHVREEEFSVNSYSFYNEYSRTKALAEDLVLNKTAERTVAPVSIRPHGIYGPGDTTLLPKLLKRIKKGRLILPEGGRMMHSLTHIDNVVQAINLSMSVENKKAEAYNVSDANPVIMYEAIKMIVAQPLKIYAIDTAVALQLSKISGQISEYEVRQTGFERTYSSGKAKKQLGYKPKSFSRM